MGQQIFDDGSTLTESVGESGEIIRSSTFATDIAGPATGGINGPSANPFTSASFSGSGLLSGLMSIIDPSNARLQAARLLQGGASTRQAQGTTQDTIINTSATSARAKDWRVSVTLADPKLFGIMKGSEANIQSILAENGGVIFPYVPQIAVQYNARYQTQQLTHSNYNNYFYEGSDINAITISGEFTVQNISEGQYLLAAIYFFRSATKMFFGGKANTGNPPPLVKLNGYGASYFPDVSCVVTQFSHTMGADVDYLEIPVLGSGKTTSAVPTSARNTVRLPTVSTVSVTVQPVYSRKNVHDNFDLTSFAKGSLITKGFL